MRMPAFGRALLARRERGDDPPRVRFDYGERWPRFASTHGGSRVAIKPGDYRPGRLDLLCLVGLEVVVSDCCESDDAIDGVPKFYFLVGDVAHVADSVWFTTPEQVYIGMPGNSKILHDPAAYAFASREFDARANAFLWPRWWPRELNEDYGERKKAWLCAAIGECLAAQAGELQRQPLGGSARGNADLAPGAAAQ